MIFGSRGRIWIELITYRNANLVPEEAAKIFGDAKPRIGAVFEDKGYVSTSMWVRKAARSRYHFNILVPKGTKAIVMPGGYGEAEILLQRGTKFRIVAVRDAPGVGAYDVDVEDLP